MLLVEEQPDTLFVDSEHEARTQRAIASALSAFPFYTKQSLPAVDMGVSLEHTLASLPLLSSALIRPTLPKAWLPESRDAKADLASGKLEVVETGFAESRVRLLWDRAWWRRQEARALRVNPRAAASLAGAFGAYREAVLWVPERGTGSCGAGDPAYQQRVEGTRLHLNSRQDPTFWSEAVMTRMLDELTQHATIGLLGDPFYVDVLAHHARSVGRSLDVRGFVALTRSLATSAQRKAIADVLSPSTPIVDVYGAREVGVMFVQGEDGKLHHAPLTTHVELLRAKVPTPGANDVALVVVTTLDREVQPLVRYVVGDLVQVSNVRSRWTPVPALESVEGKLQDAVIRPDGALVTPGAIDRALASVALRGYQVTHRTATSVDVDVVGGRPADVSDALSELFAGMQLTVREGTAVAVETNGKVRTSRGLTPPQWATLFAGCTSGEHG